MMFFSLRPQDTAQLVQLLLMHNANANAPDQVFPFSHGGSLESLIVTMVVSILSNGDL